MSKIQAPPGAPAGLNVNLARAAYDAAETKKELGVFLTANELKVLSEADMSRNGAYPKAERLPIIIPDFFLKKSMGISPAAVLAALSEKGIAPAGDEKVEVQKDIITGKSYVRVYTPPGFNDVKPGGEPVLPNEVPGRWVEITPRSPEEVAGILAKRAAASGVDAPKLSAGEKLGAAAARLSGDPRMSHVKQMLGKTIALQTADGKPTDPNDLWRQVLQASAVPAPDKHAKAGDPAPVSRLSQLAWSLAGAFSSKNGQLDWAKTQARATLIEQGMLAEAARHIDPATMKVNPNYKSLEAIAGEVSAAVKASHANPSKPTQIGAPNFRSELEALTGGKFVPTEAPQLIGNGRNEDALKFRLDTLNGTKSGDDINYAMWKFYPDAVGTQTTDALAEAAKRGVKVNVVVDGNVASRDPGEQALLQKMKDAGVNVVESFDPENPMNGMHAKMILVNCSKEAIAAGKTPIRLATDRNDGTQYLMNPKSDDPSNNNFGWSGSDMVFKGAGAAAGMGAFANLYNAAAARQGKPTIAAGSIPTERDLAGIAPARANTQVLSISDVAGPKNPQAISKAIEKLTDGVPAGQTISIDQAYFMGLPGVEAALKRAIERGVNLEIVTNSSESCDVPGISTGTTAVFERLSNAAKAAGIYGGGKLSLNEYAGKQTLHDKMMVFGDQATMRMSWNQHGRSQELECEDADVIFGKATADAARANIAKVIAHSRPVTAPTLTDEERQATTLLRGLSMELM